MLKDMYYVFKKKILDFLDIVHNTYIGRYMYIINTYNTSILTIITINKHNYVYKV